MAFIRHEIMPTAMLGITGLNPWNFVLINVFLAFLVALKKERLRWDLPGHLTWLLGLSMLSLNIALLRTALNLDQLDDFMDTVQYLAPITTRSLYLDFLISPVKWVLPPFLLFMGCNTPERFRWATISIVAMYLILALMVIRWMPIYLLVDGDALQRRAARVLGRDVGYYRTNLSIMLAGGCWMTMSLSNYFKKYAIPIYTAAVIIFIAMLLTGGRAGWGAFAALSFIIALVKWRRYLLILPMLLLVIVPFIPDSVSERMFLGFSETAETTKTDEGKKELSDEQQQLDALSAGRTLLWPLATTKIMERPFFGYGFYGVTMSGVSLEFFQQYQFPYLHPHNAYIQLLLDSGVIGALPVFLFFAFITKYAWLLFRKASVPEQVMAGASCFSLVLVFLIGAMTGQSFYPEERAFGMWCSIGLLLRAYVQYLHDPRAPKPPTMASMAANATWGNPRKTQKSDWRLRSKPSASFQAVNYRK